MTPDQIPGMPSPSPGDGERRDRVAGSLRSLADARREADSLDAQDSRRRAETAWTFRPGRRFRIRTGLVVIALIGLLLGLRIQAGRLSERFRAERYSGREADYLSLVRAPITPGRTSVVMGHLHAEQELIQGTLQHEQWSPGVRAELVRAASRLSGTASLIRGDPAYSTAQGVPQGNWVAAVDAFVAQADGFASVVASTRATRDDVRDSYRSVTASCASCHRVFTDP